MALFVIVVQMQRLIMWLGVSCIGLGVFFGGSKCLAVEGWEDLSVSELKEAVSKTQERLKVLSQFNLRGDVGGAGYRSALRSEADTEEWVEIDLGRICEFDQVVLVPSIRRDTKQGYQAEGFPSALEVRVKDEVGGVGRVVKNFEKGELDSQWINPLVIDCPGQKGRWLRITAKSLTRLGWNDYYVFSMSEVFVFNGNDNVALRKKVEAFSSDDYYESSGGRDRRYLVDGYLPYIMDAYAGEKSISSLTVGGHDEPHIYEVDLGASERVDKVSFHRMEMSDMVPQVVSSLYGLPGLIRVEGANDPSFEDSVELITIRLRNVYDTGPVMMWGFPEQKCRYVRFHFSEHLLHHLGVSYVGFSEIELFEAGPESRNALFKRTFKSNRPNSGFSRSFLSLTDGRNYYGNLFLAREWLSELAERHQLEGTLAKMEKSLDQKYDKQKGMLRALIWISSILVAVVILSLVINYLVRERHVAQVKERLAADIHDELGANLHTIGLLSDLARQSRKDEEKSLDFLQRIRAVTERTGKAMYHLAGVLEASGLYRGMVNDMERASRRIMAKYEHEFKLEGEEILHTLRPRTQIDIFLFYQECLVNISRHSGATKYRTLLRADEKEVYLSITDNGKGFSDEQKEEALKNLIPRSLKRRASLLGAQVSMNEGCDGGTEIALRYQRARWPRILRWLKKPFARKGKE